MFQTRVVERIKTHFVFSNFFRKSYCLWDNTEKYCRAGQANYKLRAGYVRLQIHTHTHTHTHINRLCNTHWFTTANKQVVQYSLVYHCNSGCTNTPQCHVSHTLPVLFTLTTVISRTYW